jgi:hypothetical protein
MMIDPSLTDPGERLLWSGRPNPAVYAMRKAAYIFPFGLFFFGFALFWIHGASQASGKAADQGMPFWLFGIPFVIAGACMVLSPAWYLFRASRTTYALTDRRAITDVSGPFPSRTSVPLHQVPFVDVRAAAQGPRHVLFQEAIVSRSNTGMAQRDGFIAIADAAQVGQLLRGAIDKAAAARIGRS